MLIQFPILIGLYRVIQSPIKYLLGVDFNSAEVLEKATALFESAKVTLADKIGNIASQNITTIVKNYQMQLSNWSRELGNGEWAIDFNFLGLDLSRNPGESFGAIMSGNFSDLSTVLLVLIPILAMFTTWLSMWHSQKMNKQAQNAGTAADMTKSMNMIMPIMTGFFAISLPAGLGVYWIASNIFQLAQQYFLDIYFKNKEDDFVVRVPEKNRKKGKKH